MLSIDITDRQLKLVRGSLAGNKIKIYQVGTRDIAEGNIVNGFVANVPLVAGEITDMMTQMKVTGDKEITICINSSNILYKELEVLKPKSLKNTAAIEAMIVTQMGISSDYNVSYSIVGDTTSSDGQPAIKLVATACPQRMVDGYQALFNQLGLKLKQINISNNCITRLILNTPKLKAMMPFLCIQVDIDFININLFEDGQVALSRYIKIDPSDYDNNPDYVNMAVFDNLYRMVEFIKQRPGARPLQQIMFYGMIRDFVALSTTLQPLNIPSHMLAMPSNIVKHCEIDFEKYANAIGAFYKVDPLKEHINLLESKVVKHKQNANLFPLQVLGVFAIAAGAVFVTNLVLTGVNAALEADIARVNQQIADGKYDQKEAEIRRMENIRDNFIGYKDAVLLSKTMYDFMPRIDLPHVVENMYQPLVGMEGNENFIAFHEINRGGYELSYTVYCVGDALDFPAEYVRRLNDLDFFEAITFTGYTPLGAAELPEGINGMGHASFLRFTLTMKLRGGHIFEQPVFNPDSIAYAENPVEPREPNEPYTPDTPDEPTEPTEPTE